MNNKISIIIPAYNIEQYIRKTLDSVLAQTYPNLEIIIVNDGSTDGTANVIDHYASMDDRIKAIHKENGGVTSARLCGISQASGEWVGFVDGDDYIEPQMYERLLENALKYQVDISHCGYQMVFSNRVDYYYNTGKLITQDNITGLLDLIKGEFIEPGLCNKLFHRSLFAGALPHMNTSVRINEDLLMNYFLFKVSQSSVFEDTCPYHYVLRSGSAATSKINRHKLYDPIKVTRIIIEDAEPSLQPLLLERLQRQLISGATMSADSQPELILPFRRECRKELRAILPQVLGSKSSIKVKIMAVWAAFWPASYNWVHRAYAKLTGLDKKYDLE